MEKEQGSDSFGSLDSSTDNLEMASPTKPVDAYGPVNTNSAYLEVKQQQDPGKQTLKPDPTKKRRLVRLSSRSVIVVSAIIAIVVIFFSGATAFILSKKHNAGNIGEKLVPTQDVSVDQEGQISQSDLFSGREKALFVNGDIITKGSLTVTNSGFMAVLRPETLTSNQEYVLPNTSGTICLNINNCNFATADQLNALQSQLGQIVIPDFPSIPASSLVNSQTGQVSIQGTSNQITVTTSAGLVKLSTPQDLGTISSPTFANLILSGNFNLGGVLDLPLNCSVNANGGTLTTNGSGQVICSDDDNAGGAATVGSPGGTSGYIPVFTAAQTIADSIISQALGTITIGGNLSASGSITFGGLSNGFLSVNGSGLVSVNTIDLGTDTVGDYVLGVTAGNGLSIGGASGEGWTPTVSLSLQANKGLEVDGNGLSLIDCAIGEILKYNGSAQWMCATDSGSSGLGDDIYVNGNPLDNANFLDSSASATNASVSLSVNPVDPDEITISVGAASATDAGIVTANAQAFGGTKTFNGQIVAISGIDNNNAGITNTGSIAGATTYNGSGLLTNTGGATISGGTVNLNATGANTTNIANGAATGSTSIGNATGTLTLTGSSASTIVLNGVTVDATELNRLDGKDAALVDTNDAVATAITGTGALNSGSITSGFGSIDTGADNITTSGTVTAGTLNVNSENFTDLTGNGLQNSANVLTLLLQASKGLEVDGSGLSLIDCANGELLKYNGSNQWACATDIDTDTGVTAVGAIDSQTKSANGAVISGTSIYMQTADGSNPGLVSTGTQTFAGDKTFNNAVIVAGLLTGQAGLAISGGAANINTTGTAVTSIGNSTGLLSLISSAGNVFNINGIIVDDTEFNRLDGKDAALVDTNDAVNTAITGTGALTSGSIGSGFGVISTTNNITTSANISTTGTGTITSAGLLTGQAGLTVTGAAVNLNASSNFATNINTGTSTGAVAIGNNTGNTAITIDSGTANINIGTGAQARTINIGTGLADQNISIGSAAIGTTILLNAPSGTDHTGSVAFNRGSDFSTTGTSNDVNFGEFSLIRLTGASSQTITGVANGRNGEILTLVNAAAQAATITNNDAGSIAANRIITGTGASITLNAGGSITLVYDSGASLWRVVGSVGFSTGNFIQNGTSPQTADFNITGSGTIGNGLTVTGSTNINTSGTSGTSIGNATGTLTLTGSSASTIVLNGVTVDATELNRLDGKDAALVDTNDAVATAITGTGALNSGSITSGFGSIDTGADNITTSGTVQGGVVNATTTIQLNGTDINTAGTLSNVAYLNGTGPQTFTGNNTFTGNLAQTGSGTFSTGTGSVSLNGNTSVTGTRTFSVGTGLSSFGGNIDVTGSVALKQGTDFTTTGTSNDVNFGDVSLVRLTGASAQTITGIAGGRDGEMLTIMNIGTQSATLANMSGSSAAGNQIITGTGANVTLNSGASITLVYDYIEGFWQVVGSVAFSANNFIQNGTSPQTADFNITGDGVIGDDLAVNGQNLTSTQTTFNLLQSTVTTLNIGAAVGSGGINLAGGSGSTGCTIDGSTGDLTCSGNITSTATSGNQGWWSRSGTTLQPATSGDNITTTGNITGTTLNGTTGINTGAGAGTQRIDNSGNLVNIGNVTTTGASTFSTTGANGFTFKPGTDNTSAFNIQNAGGSNLFQVNTTTPNIITNSSFEAGTSGWVPYGTATIAQETNNNNPYAYIGASDLKVTLNAVGDGAQYNLGSLNPSTSYYLTFAGASDYSDLVLSFGYNEGGSDIDCSTNQYQGPWTQYSCIITTGPTVTSPYIYIKSDAGAGMHLWIDNVQLIDLSTDLALDYQLGQIQLNGVITSPVIFRNSGYSVNAFQVQDQSGNSYINVDQGLNSEVNLLNNSLRVGSTLITANSDLLIQSATNGESLYVDNTNKQIRIANGWSGDLIIWNSGSSAGGTEPASVVANGYIYVLGGGTAAAQYAPIYGNGSPGTWTNTSNFPTSSGQQQAAVAYNNYIYVIGYNGGTSTYYARINSDGSLGTWQSTSAPGTGPHNFTAAVYNGYVYAAAAGTSVYYAKINANGSLGTWTSTSMTAGNRPQIVVANNKLYQFSGSFTNTVTYADISPSGGLSGVTTGTSLPMSAYKSRAVVMDGYMYVFSDDLSSTELYYAQIPSDGIIVGWNQSTNFQNDIGYQNAVVAHNGYVYANGGSYYSVNRTNLAGALDLVGHIQQNLSDGGASGAGSSLTAGNTNIIGSLNVAGQVNLSQNLGVGGDLNVAGQAVFQGANSTNAFQVQNSTANSLLSVDTATNPNLITNPSFEINTDGWAARSTATLTRITSQQYIGNASLQATTTAAANNGVKYNYSLASSTNYTLSFYARASTNTFGTMQVGRTDNGTTGGETNCLTGQVATTSVWTRFTCTFTTGTTSGTPYIYIKQSDATARTFYIDGVQLEASSSATNFSLGRVSIDGIINSHLMLQNSVDATNSLQIQNAAGTSTLLNVDTSTLQLSLARSVFSGNILPSNNASLSATSLSSVSVDTANSVGQYTSIAIGTDGLPILSSYDATNTDLRITKCNNANCTSTSTSVDVGGGVGQYTSIAIAGDGLPVISSYDTTNADLKVSKCSTPNCSSGITNTSVDTTGTVGQYTSIAIGTDGLPVVSYYDSTNADLKVTKCGNASCSSGNTTTSIDTTGTVGQYTSIAIGTDGLPVVSYLDTTNTDLKVTKCGNASCSSGNTTTSVDTTGSVGSHTSIAIGTDGLPVVSYYDSTNLDLKVTKCGNASCSSGNTATTLDSTGTVGQYNSITIGRDGLPIISYYDTTNLDLKAIKCGNTSCSSGNTTTTLDSTGAVGTFSSIKIGNDGLPIISYYDATNQDLKVTKCGNTSCSGSANTLTGGIELGSANTSFQNAYINRISTIDATNPFTIATNGVDRLTVDGAGQTVFKADSLTAFQIQNTAGTSNLFVADTTNSRIAIGQATANYKLDVNGDINITSGNSYRINGTSICTSSGCLVDATSGIKNQTTSQTNANFNIQSSGDSSITGVFQARASQTADLLQTQNSSGVKLSGIGPDGSLTANAAATGTTATTSGTGTNTTTVTLTGSAFTDGDVILIDNAGQDYYTRIVSGGGTATLTVSPAVTFENSRTVTKYTIQNVGATTTDYTTQSNRFFQGYFLGGVVTGAGSTTLSDGRLQSTGQMNFNSTNYLFQNSSNSTTALQIQNAAGEQLINVDTSTTYNLITNSNFESNTTGWAAKGSSTISQTTSQEYLGNGSMQVATTAAANDGASYNYALASQTTYTMTFYVKNSSLSSSVSTINVGRSEDGSTDSDCATAQTITGAGWARITCNFTTGNVSGTNYIYIKQTDAAARTFYVDSVQLETISALNSNTDFEVDYTGWSSYAAAGLAQSGAQSYTGSGSLQVTTSSTSGGSEGAVITETPQPSTTYNASFMVRLDGATAASLTFTIIKRMDSADSGSGSSCTSKSITADTWTNISCTFTTGAVTSPTPFIGVVVTDSGDFSTQYIYYIDNAVIAPVKWSANDIGRISLNGAINSPLTIRGQNSVAALQVQQENGLNVLTVDTANGRLGIGTDTPTKTLQVDGKVLFKATSTDTDTFQIQNTSTTNNIALSVAASTRAVNIGQSSYTANSSLNVYGTSLVNTRVNSTSAFRVQNSSNVNIFGVDTSNSRLFSGISDGASAIGFALNTSNTYSTSGAKLLSVLNNTTEKFSVDKDGNILTAGTSISGSAALTVQSGGANNLNLLASGTSNTGITAKTSNSSTAAFQIQSAANESMLNVNSVNGELKLTHAYLHLAGVPVPVSPTLSSQGTGGSLAANTYLYRVASEDSMGLQSVSISTTPGFVTTTGSTSQNTISWTQVSDAVNYYVDRSTDGGATWYRNSVGNVASIIDDGVTYTWSGSNFDAMGRINYSASAVLESGGAVMFDDSGYVYINKNHSTDDIELTNLLAGGGINVTGNDFQYTDTTGFENLFTISASGEVLFKTQTGSNSTSAFQVQNAAGNQLFNIDSTNNVITIGGNNSGEVQSVQNDSTDTFTPTLGAHSTVIHNGYVYVVGGYSGSGADFQTAIYYAKINTDGSIGAWTTEGTNPLPAKVGRHTSVVVNGYLYVIAGANTTGSDAIRTVRYAKINANGSIGTWDTTADLGSVAGDKRWDASSTTANGYIYVVGGSDATNSQDTVFYAKPNADGTITSWSTESDLLPAARYGIAAVAANGYLYAFGGGDGANSYTATYYAKINADPSTGTAAWSTDGDSLNTSRYMHGGVVSNGYIYAIGGATGSDGSTARTSIEFAKLRTDGGIDAWTQSSNALADSGRYAFGGGTVYNGYLYVIGGINGDLTVNGNYKNTIYYTSTQRIKFGGNLDLTSYSGGNSAEGNGSGGSLTAGNTNIVGLLQVAGAANFAQGVSIGGELNVAGNVSLGTGLVVSKVTDGASAVGFTLTTQSMTTAGAKLFVINNATNERFSIDKDGHLVTYGHIKSTQTTAPTIGTPTSCGTSPTSAVTANSTDSAGSFTVTAGTGSPGNCQAVITFNRAYGTAPKAVILTPTTANGAAKDVYVSATGTTTFTVVMNTAPAASEANTYYYWVVE